jgi:hypothetical protein
VTGTQGFIRLVEWNVATSLHNKARLLPALHPTVAVLPAASGGVDYADLPPAVADQLRSHT